MDEATRKEIEDVVRKLDKEKNTGVKTTDKGRYIPENERAPYNPNNIKLSKKAFVEQERKRKEKEMKLKEFSKELDNQDSAKLTPSVEMPNVEEDHINIKDKKATLETKKRGRRPKIVE